jgi:glycosyltransferase involved in cell wall biosynthesis
VSHDRAVSLVVPLQDEERTVCALLRSIAQQSHLPTEIVLVDAGSRDRTIEEAVTVDLPRPLRIVRTSRVFPGVARNEGVGAAGFEWIAFTDGGIVLHPDWLRELLAALQQSTDAIFGNLDPVCDTFFRECAALAYVPPRDEHGVRGPFVASSLIRRTTFLGVGGFPPYRAAEDLIFVERLRAAGALIAYAPKAQVRWEIAGSLGMTFDRFANYSQHNLVAGWGRYWHFGVARLYGLLALAVLVVHLAGAGVLAWLALPLFFAARAAKAGWVKRHSFAFSTLRPARILGAAGILAVLDAATAMGLFRWLHAKVRP